MIPAKGDNMFNLQVGYTRDENKIAPRDRLFEYTD